MWARGSGAQGGRGEGLPAALGARPTSVRAAPQQSGICVKFPFFAPFLT